MNYHLPESGRRAFAKLMLVSGLVLSVSGASQSAIPISSLFALGDAQDKSTLVAMRGGGNIGGARTGMGGPPIIYLPPSGPSMHSPGMRAPSFRAPSRSQLGRSGGQRQKNPAWGNQQKSPTAGKKKRYTTPDKSLHRKHAGWKKTKPGWKPDYCKNRWQCRHHRYKNPYYYAYYDDWYDFYDYYDSPNQADEAHIRWCKKRYRSYNVRTDRYLGNRGKYRRCVSPYAY